MWVVLLSVIGGVVGLLFMVNEGMIGYMPDMQALSNPVDKFASQIVTSDGKLMGTYSYGATNRLFTEYDSIAPAMVEALVATEDERFYDHSGIDFRALLRAVVKRGVMGQKSAAGEAVVQRACDEHYAASPAEADRVAYCCEAGALLYQAGDHNDVSQLF